MSGGKEGKIRHWQVVNGREVRLPMDAAEWVWNTAVSQDGKWIVAGTTDGRAQVWNLETYEKESEFEAHSDWVHAVDVPPD